jgi:hypothetical protein
MPLIPPWPIEVAVLLRAAEAVLRRAEQADPRDPAVGAMAADVTAMLAKLEALARPDE